MYIDMYARAGPATATYMPTYECRKPNVRASIGDTLAVLASHRSSC